MGSPLPEIPLSRFRARLRRLTPVELRDPIYESLHRHYSELRRWNRLVSLVGPGTAGKVLDRHYGESLAALPLLRPSDRVLVDVGSGAGFPGLVLAAACPRLEVTLAESRERKCVFLKSVIRLGGLSSRCLNARVSSLLPEGFPKDVDVVTCRAVVITPETFEAICRSSPYVRFLLWQGQASPSLLPGLVVARELAIAGSRHRRILEVHREAP